MSVRKVPTAENRLSATLRNFGQRITRLEQRPDGRANASHELPVRLGGWVLDVNGDGDLTATSPDGNTTTLASA